MIQFIFGCAGSGKTQVLYNKIRELYNDGVNNMILLVPEQSSFETEKDMLDLLGEKGQYSVDVLSFSRFCDRLQSEYSYEKDNCINNIGRRVLMMSSIKECDDGLELFSNQTNDINFSETLLSLYEQMKMFQLSSENLLGASTGDETVLGSKLRDIGMIFATYENKLQGEYYDPSDRLTRAANALNDYKFFENKIVFIDAFKGFTEQQYSIIEHIVKQSKDCYIALTNDKQHKGSVLSPFLNIEKLFKRIKQTANANGVEVARSRFLDSQYRLKSEELRFIEQCIYSNDELKYENDNENITVFSCRDIYEESDAVAKEIHRLVREEGYRYRDFAVVSRNIEDYFSPLFAAFVRRGVAYYADYRRPVYNKAIFRLVRYALKSARTLASDDIISTLKTGIFGMDEFQISELENYTDIWQIKKEWHNEWTGSPSGLGKLSEKDAKKLDLINEYRKMAFEPLKRFANKLSTAKTVEDYCKSVFDFTQEMNAEKHLFILTEHMKKHGDIDLAEDELQSYDAFISVLDQMYMSVGNSEITSKEFGDLFDAATNSCDIGEIPRKFDEVIIGAADRIRPKSPKITFILGINYGVFPRVQSENSIFTKTDFEVLTKKGCKLSHDGIDEQTDERFLAYTLLCSPSEKLYVSYVQRDNSGQGVEPSELIEMLDNLIDRRTFNAHQIENECDALGILANGVIDEQTVCAEKYFNSKGYDYKALSMQNVAPIKLSKSTAERCFGNNIVLSASKIDVYYKCRFRYLCQYVLKLKSIKTASVDVMERGTIVHCILEQTVERYSDNPESIMNMSDEELTKIVSEMVKEEMSRITDGRELTNIEIYSKSKLAKMLCKLVRRIFNELSNTDFKVMYTELNIGNDDAEQNIPAFEVEVDDKRKVVITGMIDRTDIYEKADSKFVRIIDYKTGTKSLKLSDVVKGHNIQMVLYMMAIVKHMRESGENVYPAGMYYMPAKIGIVDATDEPEKAVGKINDKQRGTGITLDDEDVIDAMDKTEELKFTPVKYRYNKPNAEYLFKEKHFDIISEKIEQILRDMGKGLYENNFNAEPISPDNGQKNVCDYCDYRSICGREKLQGVELLKSKKNSEILEELVKGDERSDEQD